MSSTIPGVAPASPRCVLTPRGLVAGLTGVLCVGAVAWSATGSVALHVLQHVVLVSLLPLALVAVLPTLWPQRPYTLPATIAAVVLGLVVFYGIHVPAVFNADRDLLSVRLLAHAALLAAGVLFALPVSGPRVASPMRALVAVAATELGVGALGMYLAWGPHVVYALAAGQPGWLGLDPVSEQALGGAFLLVIAEPVLAVEVTILFMRALSDGDGDHATTIGSRS